MGTKVPKSRECAAGKVAGASGFGYSHVLVSPQALKRSLKVQESKVEPLQQKIGDSALKVSDG